MKIKVFNYYGITVICLLFMFKAGAQPANVSPKSYEELKKLDALQQRMKAEQGKLEAQQQKLAEFQLKIPELLAACVEPPAPPPVPEPAPFAKGGNFQPETTASVEKNKTIVRSFSVKSKDKLLIDNQFGNINVNTWSKNEIRVQIDIKAFESSESRAEKLLENVTVSEGKSANLISFKTNISRDASGGWWGIRQHNGRDERRGVQIIYTINMPSKNALDITNKYGAVVLPELSGEVNVDCSYGSLKAGKLSHPANKIKVSYGSASFDAINSANLDVSYGSLKIGSADKLNADVKYSSAEIGKLSGNSDINLKYSGGFKISEIDRSVKNLNVNAAYSTVALGFAPASGFDFDVTVSYAGFKYDDNNIMILSKSPEAGSKGFQATKNYKGQIGKGSDAKVVVNSRYGSVRFN